MQLAAVVPCRPMGTTETLRPLISAEQIHDRIAALGEQISADYEGKQLVVVPVLKGSFVFAADLLRQLRIPAEVDFLAVRSYDSGTETSGAVRIVHDLTRSIAHQHVLIVEDIVDSGLTMQYLQHNLATRQPASVKLASLLHKPDRARVEVAIDYLGFRIEDRFVVGYGLDFEQRYRHLPYLAELEFNSAS